METVNVSKDDFNKILNTIEILISDFERVISQNEVISTRIEDVKSGKIKGKSEEDYKDYLKKRMFH